MPGTERSNHPDVLKRTPHRKTVAQYLLERARKREDDPELVEAEAERLWREARDQGMTGNMDLAEPRVYDEGTNGPRMPVQAHHHSDQLKQVLKFVRGHAHLPHLHGHHVTRKDGSKK